MRNALLGALVALLLADARACATPAYADRDALGQIADELGRIRRVLEKCR